MKELTSYNRVAGYLNKVFDLLNAAFFESVLSRPTITIQSTPRAYGHFSLREDTWVSKLGAPPLSYGEIKSWFLEQYPEFAEFQEKREKLLNKVA